MGGKEDAPLMPVEAGEQHMDRRKRERPWRGNWKKKRGSATQREPWNGGPRGKSSKKLGGEKDRSQVGRGGKGRYSGKGKTRRKGPQCVGFEVQSKRRENVRQNSLVSASKDKILGLPLNCEMNGSCRGGWSRNKKAWR